MYFSLLSDAKSATEKLILIIQLVEPASNINEYRQCRLTRKAENIAANCHPIVKKNVGAWPSHSSMSLHALLKG
jgi:hypothetical protein